MQFHQWTLVLFKGRSSTQLHDLHSYDFLHANVEQYFAAEQPVGQRCAFMFAGYKRTNVAGKLMWVVHSLSCATAADWLCMTAGSWRSIDVTACYVDEYNKYQCSVVIMQQWDGTIMKIFIYFPDHKTRFVAVVSLWHRPRSVLCVL